VVGFLGPIFQPGFFSNAPVRTAIIVGGCAAVASAAVGVFTVIRGQSFAGHSLADIGTAGGSAAILVGANPLYGFVAMNMVAAGVMELIGVRRPRGRDMATGIVLGAALGLAALFLYFDTTTSSTSGATVNVLFGSVFTFPTGDVPAMVVFSLVAVGLIGVLFRPLVLSSLSTELATARGIRVGLISGAYLVTLALAVSLSAVTIGAILSTALLIGPAASALRLVRGVGRAMLVAAVIGVLETWLGILLAYDSYDWPPAHQGWPVSFFVVTIVLLVYVGTGPVGHGQRGRSPGVKAA
jgi:zinc/manganese transport system permease protein